MSNLSFVDDTIGEVVPLIFVLSDSGGETAVTVVKAAAAQFGSGSVEISRLPNVSSVDAVSSFIEASYDPERPCAVFHTFANGTLRREIRRVLDQRGIPSIDLLGPAVTVLATLTGEEPTREVGAEYYDKSAD